MAAKTYLPGLYFVCNTAYRYVSRWQNRLLENEGLSSQQIACINSIVIALAECVQLFKPAAPSG